MRGNNPAWLIVISAKDHVPAGIQCGEKIRRNTTVGSVLAIVSPVVGNGVISKLQTTFDYVIFGEADQYLEPRDGLLLQALKFSSFSKLLVVDPSVMNINESEQLLDSYDILVTPPAGKWKAVAISPNVSKWKSVLEIVSKSSGTLSHDDFIKLVAAHFGGNLKQLDSWNYNNPSDVDQFSISSLNNSDTKNWVAIVGMSCRFPGANSVEEYWDILKNGVNTSSLPSKQRVLLSNLGPNVLANYLKCPIDEFDAQFFGMAPTEVAFTDCQSRLILEVSYEAFEDAGVNLAKLRGTHTGIFHGSWISDYKECLNNIRPSDEDLFRKYVGNSLGGTAGKLSFFYGLTGPSVGTDSACSSSMMAVELASKSLLEGDCPLAVATGTNILLQHDTMTKVVWSEDGICKTFDSSANGYGRADGVAAVVLKRYSDAIRDNDRIHGIIRGSASSQEGLSRSFGTPTVESEALAMKKALLKSGVKPEQVGYVEAHATGTGVGDPIEATAIVKAYSSPRTSPLWIGSGKTNIGHAESASGLAALIKVVLALKHELIPPHINLRQLNPRVNFEQIPGKIPMEAVPWTRSSTGQPRIAGVSNFGITGTDVHMIIQEAPKTQQKKGSLEKKNGPPIHFLALSAKSETALQQLTNSYIELLQTMSLDDEEALANIAYTTNARRTHYTVSRKIGVGRTKTELISSLQQTTHNKSVTEHVEPLKICMFFSNETLRSPANKSLYSSLYSTSKYFSKEVENCDKICKKIMGLTPSGFLNSEQEYSKINEKERQLCSFTVSLSLFKLWESWGVKPNLIVAHGIGELAGKVAANLLTIEEAFKLIHESTFWDETLTKGLKNQNPTGEVTPYFALDTEEMLNAAANNNGCRIRIKMSFEDSPLFQNDSKIILRDIGSSLEAAERPWLQLLSSLAALYESGYNIDWEGVYRPNQHQFQLVSLPHYPFQRKSYWFRKEATKTKELSPESIHPLLGVNVTNALNPTDDETTYQNWLGVALKNGDFLADHVIGNEVIFPAAGYLEMSLAAQHFAQGDENPVAIENFTVHQPLHLELGGKKTIQTISNPATTSIYGYEVDTTKGTPRMRTNWKMYASCDSIATTAKHSLENVIDVGAVKAELEVQPDKFYGNLASLGLQFGPRFQSIQKLARGQNETLATLANIPEAELGDYVCHPVLIDAMIQCFILAKEPVPTTLQVPVAIQKFICFSRPSFTEELYVYCNLSQAETVYLMDSKNNVIAIMYTPVLKKTTIAAVLNAAGVNNKKGGEVPEPETYEVRWKPSPNSNQPASFMKLNETEDYTDSPTFSSLIQYFGERNGFSRREKLLDENINRLVSLYVLNALYELGWLPNQQNNIEMDEVALNLKVEPALVPAFRKFFSYVDCLDGVKSHEETKREIEKILTEQASNYVTLQKIIHPCGSQLAAVFKGQVQNQDLFELSKLYWETGRFFNDGLKVSTQVFTEVAREMWEREGGRESHKIMRILDVGNDARKFVDEVLSALDDDDIEYEYWLTSSNPQINTRSANVILVKLDIGSNPLDQGLPPSHFDIVVAQNSLHSTKNCRKSVEHLKLLTKIGGIIIIEEMNGPVPELDLVFGHSEHYWNHEEFDVPALNVESWAHLMEKVGFHATHKIHHSGGNMGVIVAQLKSRELDEARTKTQEKSWLVVSTQKHKVLEDTTRKLLMKLQKNLVVLTLVGGNSGIVEEAMQNHKETLEGILFVVEDESGMEADNYGLLLKPLLQVSQGIIKVPWKSSIPKLIVATKGCSPLAATLWGFMRTAQFEIPGLSSKLIELDPHCETEERLNILLDEVWRSNDDEREIQYRNGVRLARRLQKSEIGRKSINLEIPVSESGNFSIELPPSNLISDLKYSAVSDDETPLKPDEVEIRVESVSLNFRDVFSVLKPSPEFEKEIWGAFGNDFAGKITALGEDMMGEWKVGDLVFGIAKRQTGVRGLLRYSTNILAKIPKNMTFSEAATFPVAFATAWHCIVNVAQAKKGQTILIHAASGGVGLMAIQIAKYLGLNIIGTAGSERKRKYLAHFGLQHVFGSRTLEFGNQIMEVTNGKGVDVVLNCLTRPGFKETSLETLKDGGYFVEISKLDIWQPKEVENMRPDVSYKIVDINELEDSFLKTMLEDLVVLVEEGSLHPIPYTQFSASRIINGFTFLQKAKQIGKVNIEMASFDRLRKELKENLFNSRSTYLITGGKGAIGLAIAEWMVSQGAKYLVLLGRSPPSGKALETINGLEEKGTKILCLKVDISDYAQCKKVIEDIESTYNLPSLQGVHHCAGVLSDKMIVHQKWEDFEHVLAPKVKGAYNLHELTIGKSLQFFVLHSSMSATLGNAGQSNYAAANAYMEALIEMRHGMGLNGLCVSWGQWNAGLGENLELKAFHAFNTAQGIRALEHIFWERHENPCVAVGSIKMEELVKLRPIYEKTLLEELYEEGRNFSPRIKNGEKGKSVEERKMSFLEEYKQAEGLCGKELTVQKLIKELLTDTLGVPFQDIEDDVMFSTLGMDSILSIEFYNKVQLHLGDVKLGFVDMDVYGTLAKMVELIKNALDDSAKEN